MAAEPPRSSSGSADSYIGSLISLTSKSEIRYEGILFNINTQESSIGLRNVRSFGTEGRKKDGPQVAPIDKIYEYILFRGSDIRDLQVKSSPPVQSTMSIHHDPAIIQSHYPPQVTTASVITIPSGTGSIPNPSLQTQQMGLHSQTFQSSAPLYQPSGNLGSWGSSAPPPTTSLSGHSLPMYWPGFSTNPNGFQSPNQSLLHPPPALSSLNQATQYPVLNGLLNGASSSFTAPQFSELPSPLLPSFSSGTLNLQSSIFPTSSLGSDFSTNLISEKDSAQGIHTVIMSNANLSSLSPLTSSSISDKTAVLSVYEKSKIAHPSVFPFKSTSDSDGTASSALNVDASRSLVTPDQLLQLGPTIVSSSSQPLPTIRRDVEVVQASSLEVSPPLAQKEAQEPLLPLPDRSKLRGARPYVHHYSRGGRESGRGNGISRPVTRFTEEFDFTAMNEKFNKDEVWGDLGRSSKVQEYGSGSQDDDDVGGSSKHDVGPGYVKDDFFDSLSCDALGRGGSQSGRTRFSEQQKRDTETFGYSPRYRGRGGRGFSRGRGYSRGGWSPGVYYGRGYSHAGRGWGHSMSDHAT